MGGAQLPRTQLARHATAPAPCTPPEEDEKTTRILISSPENEEAKPYGKLEKVRRSMRIIPDMDPEDDKDYDPYALNEAEFGMFILDKVNDKTAKRLMQHLNKNKQGKNSGGDGDGDDVIKANQCIHVMLFACVLYLKYKEKTENKAEIQIDKKKLKKSLMPSFDWMMENKLKDIGCIKKNDYKVLGQWLKEYWETK